MWKKVVIGVCLILVAAMLVLPFLDQYASRNLFLAVVADRRAGEAVGEFQPDYTRDQIFTVGNIYYNSYWLADKVRLILPYMSYENVAPSYRYPSVILFVPEPGERSFHIGGSFSPFMNVVSINERYILDNRWNDEADTLETLVHELVHTQGGAYLADGPEDFESATSAATVEILAAMCNYGNRVACRAFWNSIHDMSRSAFRTRLYDRGLGWLYEDISNLLFRNNFDERAARKAMRYWANDMTQLAYIYRAYQVGPWENHVIPGVWGYPMENGFSVSKTYWDGYSYVSSYLIFDDTADLMGWLKWFMSIR